jgi:hypothetical protein
MTVFDFSGDFLNVESTKDGDIVVFLDGGRVEYNEVLKKNLTNFAVEVNSKRKTYSPTQKAGQEFQKAFGEDSDNWIGKKFEVLHVQGKMVVRPIKEVKI